MYHGNNKGEMWTTPWTPLPLGPELRKSFQDGLQYVVTSTFIQDHVISFEDKKFSQLGQFMDAGAPEMLTLEMVSGTRADRRI